AVQELHPGRGYFLKASAAGTIRISSAGNVTGKEKSGKSLAQDEVQNSFDRLTFEAEGITQHLFIGGRLSGGWNRENFALPPQPPRPDLDVRLADDYRLSESDSVTVSLEAAEFPVAVTLENAVNNDEYRLTLFREGQKPEILTLQPGTESYINKPVDYLSLMPVGETAGELPETVELKPSYPNPFNPATTIRYAIPEQMQVTLEVYDLLGQKVTRLVDKEHSAGNYQIRFNASDLSSGIYFVQILAGSHQEVQKITLIK
ncbi:MAG: T9SS type A sorting domain-containing protein, partial [Balneolaceae bacterium]|nr:T9SS type A sorting domain-containing protein [Balneolaceae bacterium]